MTSAIFPSGRAQMPERSRTTFRPAMPTICHVLHSLGVGGGEVLAARMARRLSDRYRFVFACLDEVGTLGEQLRGDGFAVHVLGRRSGVDWRCARRFATLVREEAIDLAHAHQYAPFFYSAAARILGGRWSIVFTEHGRTFPDYRRKKRVLANRFLLRRRDRAIGVGQAVGDALIRNEGLPAARVGVIYNGIDLSRYVESTSDGRESLLHEWGFDQDDFIILQVARLDPLKDHATAIRAIERLAGERLATHERRVRLVLVGEGPERTSIEAEIARRGLGDVIKLLGMRQDVPRLLRAADLLILTSVSEGIPLTLIEGMAAGLPVVATDVGGVAEVVVEGVTGLLAPAGDDAALATAVARLAGDGEMRRRMGELGRGRAFERFAEDQMTAAYAACYEDLLRG